MSLSVNIKSFTIPTRNPELSKTITKLNLFLKNIKENIDEISENFDYLKNDAVWDSSGAVIVDKDNNIITL